MTARVVVFGAGAMGSWIGGLLSSAGNDVTLVARQDHATIVAARGLRTSGKTESHTRPKAVTRAQDAGVPDVLLLTTKAYDTRRAIEEMRPLVGARTTIVSMQNGLGNIEALGDAFDERQVLAAVTTHGVTFVEPGHVQHAGFGYFYVGSPYNEHERAGRFADLLKPTGLNVEATPRIRGEIWAKVVVNAAINPLTAITGLRNGALLEVPALREVMQRTAEEAVDVARAEGAPLPEDDLLARARRVAELTATNKSSMLQDVERGRMTEIDAICGEIVQRGAKHAIDTPVNLALRAMVKGIEESTRR